MKIIATVLVAAAVIAAPLARAGEIKLVSDKQLCDNAPPLKRAAAIKAKRAKGKVIVAVTAELNCAYKPGTPKLHEWRNAATIVASTVSPSDLATACLCQHLMKYEITGLYEGTRTIYYVQDGAALGHVSAP